MMANIQTHIDEIENYSSISFRDRKVRPTRSVQSQLMCSCLFIKALCFCENDEKHPMILHETI